MAFHFGAGVLQVSATAGLVTLGKLQDISVNISYQNVQMRGDRDVFPVNTQFFDGAIDGTIKYADIELSSLGRLIAGSGSVGGAGGSGTATFTALSKPSRFQLILSGVTNGVTSTLTLDRVYIPSLSPDFTMTELEFIVEAASNGEMGRWQN